MDRAWCAAVQGFAKSRTRLSDFSFTFHFHVLEKEMATHSSVLAWRIPGTGEPGGLPSMGSHRVGHDWRDLAAAAETFLMSRGGVCYCYVMALGQVLLKSIFLGTGYPPFPSTPNKMTRSKQSIELKQKNPAIESYVRLRIGLLHLKVS